MKKAVSLIMCAAMLLASTSAFAKMVGYHPAKSEINTYYFEAYNEPVEVDGTVYYTISNTRKAMSGKLYGYIKETKCPVGTTITVLQPLNSLSIGYHKITADGTEYVGGIYPDGFAEEPSHGIMPGTTYTLNQEGVYEIYRNSNLDGFIRVVPADDAEIAGIVSEQVVTDNPLDYIPVYADDESVSDIPEISVTEGSVIAFPTDSELVVEKGSWLLDAYNINGNNYFKLRDLAFAFTYEDALRPFDVTWDSEKNAINLISNKKYTAVGGECGGWDVELSDWPQSYWDAILNGEKKVRQAKVAIPTTSEIYIDGVKVNLAAYNIDGNNYFKLRDLAQAFNFEVNWDPVYNMIYVSTYGSYMPE